MKVLMIDNFDSFTFNLVHYIEEHEPELLEVWRNDAIDFERVDEFDKIIISPGPGLPSENGDLLPFLEAFYSKKNILGICLGQQAIVEVLGGKLKQLPKVYHGVNSTLTHFKNVSLFDEVSTDFEAGRYHSWVADTKFLPPELLVTCTDEEGNCMGIKHKRYPLYGIQFHPESILTPQGKTIIKNWLLN